MFSCLCSAIGTNGIQGYGSPSALPLTCNALSFGPVSIGSYSSMTITCTVTTPLKILGMILGGVGVFQSQNSSLPTTSLAIGSTFSFSVIFNLTQYSSTPAVKTAVLNLLTNNTVAGFSTEVPILVTGKATSNNPIISMSPLQVSFSGLIIPSASAYEGSVSSLVISNLGQNSMTISGYAFATGTYTNSPNSPVTNVTFTNGVAVLDVNAYFTSSDLPPVGTVIQGGAAVSIDLLFNTTVRSSYLIWCYLSDILIGPWKLFQHSCRLFQRRVKLRCLDRKCYKPLHHPLRGVQQYQSDQLDGYPGLLFSYRRLYDIH